ncbi:MAG TPA: type II toxin-antitoxin system RelE/ParE family toxin [Polyangiaceae bacterium]|nr:type II toxin-antitoxin system RelE/ParE family toxin [Polyangiaceae bacterium]
MRLILTETAKADIRDILRSTRVQFGPLQVKKYRALIAEARKRLRETPGLGHHRDGLPPEGRLFHISQRGRPASHFLAYFVDVSAEIVVVVRVVHDAMDVPLHWPIKSQ